MESPTNRPRRLAPLLVCLPILLTFAPPRTDQPAVRGTGPGSKTWIGRYHEMEEYLRTAECVRMQELAVAGTLTRCDLPPGGPIARMSWKPLPPGVYRGFRESYKSDIAAYETDKLLKLDMVPPTVEREIKGHKGAATQWVENVVDWTKIATSPNASDGKRWARQLATMWMFDNFIGNKDRNRQNILADAAGNLILIDHSRAFGPDTDLPHKLTEIDRDLWARLERVTRAQLDRALSAWLDEAQIGAILARRERMKAEIRSLGRR